MINKTDVLLKQDQVLFHTDDLALLWEITNRNTLYTTIKRYVKQGILHRIHKGFYSSISTNKIDTIQLAISSLNRYCYLSTETVLTNHGIIHQEIKYITLISDIAQKFSINNHSCSVRKIPNNILFNTTDITEKNGIKIANINRAIADLIYFNPNFFFDRHNSIDWRRVKQIQKEIGYK